MKKVIIASIFALALVLGSASTASAAYTFANYLRVGSTGADVTALQSWLVSQNFLTMPAGVSMGYFGQLTKAAVVKYQASVGLPATGFVGPLTVAKLNGGSVASAPAAGCPAGYTCTPVGGTTTSTGSVSTVGVEGTILVTEESSGVKTSIYEADTMDAILGFKVEAKTSDALVQRVKVIIGTTTNSYSKVFKKVYLTDASGNVLASKDLNSSTVDRDSSTQYSVTLSGFSALVKKDTKSSFYVKFDLNGSISSTYRVAQYVAVPVDGVRAQDGAGLDQYGPTTLISKAPSISASLADSATLTLSTDPDVIKSQTIVANSGSNSDEADMVTVGSFRALAEKDGVLVRDIKVTASSTSGVATQPTAYLFEGSKQIGTASASTTGTVTDYTFTSIDRTIGRDQTKVYTVKVDVRSASTAADIFKIASVTVNSAESVTSGANVSVTALSTVGNDLTFVSKGAITTLASTPSITITAVKDTSGNTTEAHLTSTFNVNINAIGADAVFNGTSTAFSFKVYRGSTDITALLVASSTNSIVAEYNQNALPSGFTASSTGTGFTVPRNVSGTIPVTFRIDTTGTSTVAGFFPNTGSYSVRLNSVTYVSGGTSVTNDNSTNQAWVTSAASRP